MAFDLADLPNSTSVRTTSADCKHVFLETKPVLDLLGLEIENKGIMLVNKRIRVSDNASVMTNGVRHSLCLVEQVLNPQKLPFLLAWGDPHKTNATLDVKAEAELIVGLVNGNNVHKTCRELRISSNLAIDFDEPLLQNKQCLAVCEGIFQAIADNQQEWQTLLQLMWARPRPRGENTRHF
jgi:hypothetical protein